MSKKQGGTREGMRYRGLRYGEGKERVRVRTMGRGSRDNGGTEGGDGGTIEGERLDEER